ncbi:MAG: dihydropteroate synthase [Marinilabiliales bacterium]
MANLDIFNKSKFLNIQGKLYDLSIPKVMGILNLTPDSFYDGGKYNLLANAEKRINEMIAEGADIIDIGAVSTRPGADMLDFDTEIKRLKPVLELITNKFDKYIFSLDTFRADVARFAVENYNIGIINDISAGNIDDKMFETIAKLRVPYIIMHMQGTPSNMQKNPVYDNVIKDLIMFFAQKIQDLKSYGIHDILIDPGFGFGKTIEHNYTILKNLKDFRILERPIVVGLSRKSMIYKLLNTTQDKALNGTTIVNTISILNGADIIRVHDVKEAKEIIRIFTMIKD